MRTAQHQRPGLVRARVTNPAGKIAVDADPSVSTAHVTLSAAMDDEVAAELIENATIDSSGETFTITVPAPPPTVMTSHFGGGTRVIQQFSHIGRGTHVVGVNVRAGGDMIVNQVVTSGAAVITSSPGSVLVTVHVPVGSEIQADSRGGDVEVTGDVDAVEASTAGGDITVAYATRVQARSQGGDVNLDQVHTATARSQGGDVRVGRATGQVDLSTQGGDVRAHDLAAGGKLRSQGGDVRATLTGNAPLTARTQGGDVQVHTGPGVDKQLVPELVTVSSQGGEARVNGRRTSKARW